MTTALDAYKAAMAAARTVFDGTRTADNYRAGYDAYNAAIVAAYLAYDLAYQLETIKEQT